MLTTDRKQFDARFLRFYSKLRRIACRRTVANGSDSQIRPTQAVHEVFLRLIRLPIGRWNDTSHFEASAVQALKHVFIDHHRREKNRNRIELSRLPAMVQYLPPSDELDRALRRLRLVNSRHGVVAQMHVVFGLTHHAIAQRLDVSERTVKRDWCVARAWLARELRNVGL